MFIRLFRHKASEEPLLLIYRNDPCVVIGRNQNPWKEVTFRTLRERPGVPVIRRRSGGGTVYHVGTCLVRPSSCNVPNEYGSRTLATQISQFTSLE